MGTKGTWIRQRQISYEEYERKFAKIFSKPSIEMKKYYLKLRFKSKCNYDLYFYNSAKLGSIYRAVDGDYVFSSECVSGCWSTFSLQLIVDLLNKLNCKKS